MHDPLGMGRAHSIGNLDSVSQSGRCTEGSDFIPERRSLEKLGDNERPAVVFADVMDRQDIRVLESGGSTGLSDESLDAFRLVTDTMKNELDCNISAQSVITSAVDLSHAA